MQYIKGNTLTLDLARQPPRVCPAGMVRPAGPAGERRTGGKAGRLLGSAYFQRVASDPPQVKQRLTVTEQVFSLIVTLGGLTDCHSGLTD